MKVKKPQLGELVRSTSGRDRGRYYIVKEIVNDDYITVVDGMLRKVAKPKKKNLKHLELKPLVFEGIAQKFAEESKVFDQEIASALMSSEYYER